MLTLTRKDGESVEIWDNSGVLMTITIRNPNCGRAQLSFDAPKNLRIYRAELQFKQPPPPEES